MSGIIEKYAQTPVTIRKRVGIVDGKPEWEDFGGLAIIFDFSQRDLDYFGDVKNGSIFLVSPTISQAPDLPGQILCDGKCYDIHGVKTYRNLKGKLLGYRIAVVGG